MPPHKRWSLADPRVCSRIISIAEVDRRHAALEAPPKSGQSRGPSAHRVRAKTCRKLRHGGQAEVAVAAVGRVPGLLGGVRRICRWKAFWAQNRAVLAHRERMGPWRLGAGPLRRTRTEVRQRASTVRPSGSCVAEQARTGPLHTIRVAAPSREDETNRSWRPRRTIAALPGAGRAGNSTSASAASSPLSARVSARVMRRRTKRRSESRKRQARES